jgi:anti-sigma regulatory factor (Ser/Thr protein kinase)
VARYLTSLQVAPRLSADIQLAVTEACTNVVCHAYPDTHGDVLFEAEATPDEIVIRIADRGCPADHPSAQPGLGLGIRLIDRLADHTTRTHINGVKRLEIRFNRQPAIQ